MKTKKQVLQENPDRKRLINAVINNIGLESVQDVSRSGADAGFSGFIYYSDTHKFALRHRKAIVQWLNDTYAECGYKSVVEMVENFGVFRGNMDEQDFTDFYRYMGGCKVEQGQITNVMAWFALEEVCRLFED